MVKDLGIKGDRYSGVLQRLPHLQENADDPPAGVDYLATVKGAFDAQGHAPVPSGGSPTLPNGFFTTMGFPEYYPAFTFIVSQGSRFPPYLVHHPCGLFFVNGVPFLQDDVEAPPPASPPPPPFLGPL